MWLPGVPDQPVSPVLWFPSMPCEICVQETSRASRVESATTVIVRRLPTNRGVAIDEGAHVCPVERRVQPVPADVYSSKLLIAQGRM